MSSEKIKIFEKFFTLFFSLKTAKKPSSTAISQDPCPILIQSAGGPKIGGH
jgi:hypothetical protein